MAPMGRRLKLNDHVLLPKGSCLAPLDGILYGQIVDTCLLGQTNQFNASVSKRKPGWTVRVYTTDDAQNITIDIPKSYPLIQYCSTELEQELELRPKEFLGMFIGRGLLDKSENTFINYGQVTSVSIREGECYCTVTFRRMPDGSTIENMDFLGEDLMDYEVSIMQYALGLGVNVPYTSADRRVTKYRTVLENMDKSASHATWLKEFCSFGIARADQQVFDQFLEQVELNLPKIFGKWSALKQYLPVVEEKTVAKDLRVDFNLDNEGFGECISGNPVTPVRVAASMHSQNQRRQEFRSSAIPQVLPLPPGHQRHVPMKDTVEAQQEDLKVEVQRGSFERLQLPSSGYESSSPNHAATYSKHSYHPSRAQLQKHMITFRDGAYGKSYTLEEATAGIEDVLAEELRFSVKTAEAYIRTWCIMMGDLLLVPWGAWRTNSLLANNFEENYLPVKWTKLPELKSIEVTDIDDFWSLYHAMEEAAARYYVTSYCVLLGRVRTNIQGGFMVLGGRVAFTAMRAVVRRNVIHVLVGYLRLIVGRFISEVLTVQADPVEWMNREATTSSPIFTREVSTKLTALQFTDMMARTMATNNGGGGPQRPHGNDDKKGEWSSKMPDGMHATIPKQDGKNMCLLSYTRQGCKRENDGCKYKHKKAGSPNCPVPVQEWIASTYGSYVGP